MNLRRILAASFFISAMIIFIMAGCSSNDSPTDPDGGDPEGPFTWYVDANTMGTGDGKSWANAFEHPSEAMAAAAAGDQIWVALANYYGSGDKTIPVLTFKAGVKVYGGFGGTETDLSQRNPADRAIFDGGDSLRHIVVGADDALLHGFKITGGNADGNFATGDQSKGGGIYCFEAKMKISNCDIYSNSAGYGGGIFAEHDTVVIDSCLIDDNSQSEGGSFNGGGGIYVRFVTAAISQCTIRNNTASAIGGGLYLNNSMATVSNCDIYDNSTTGSMNAGGMYIMNAISQDLQPEFISCRFAGNSAFEGGAAAIYKSNPHFTDCEFEDNISRSTNYSSGAAINSKDSSFLMEHCRFDNNSGTAAFVSDPMGATLPRFFNCLFTRNGRNEDFGGAIYNSYVGTEIEFCTFDNNEAGNGAAIYSVGISAPKVTNCILWFNNGTTDLEHIYDEGGATTLVTYTNIDQDGYDTGTGNMRSDPQFVAGPRGAYYLSHTGAGPGQATDSPCINAGSNTAISFLLHTMTTRSDNITDADQADLGYHYEPDN